MKTSTLWRQLLLCLSFVSGVNADDLRSHGAVGDGKTDDTEAIQKAIDAGSGGIHFGKGIYRLTKPVVIDLDHTGFTSLNGDGTATIVMEGAGPAFKFVGTHKGTADPKDFAPDVWQRQRAPMVEGLEIIGANPAADGIEVTGTMELTITRVLIREMHHGIHLITRNRNVLIADCHIYHNSGIGIFLDAVDLHQINVSASHISYNAGGGVVSRAGNVRNLQISGCDIESNMSAETAATANVLIDCSGSATGTAEVAITGCTLQHNSKSPDSANIRVLGRGDPGQNKPAADWGHVIISGNVMSDVQVNVHLRQARGVTLTGNTFWMGYQHDLLVEESSNIVLGPNAFDRNPAYAYGTSAQANGGLEFHQSRDCTLSGLHVNGAWRKTAAIVLQGCDRFNLTGLTILDCDGLGLLLDECTRSHVSNCLIRDDRAEPKSTGSIKAVGGGKNNIFSSSLSLPVDLDLVSGKSRDNEITN